MGLLYLLPVDIQESDLVQKQNPASKESELRSYGLPLLFLFFMSLILLVMFLMGLMIMPLLPKLRGTDFLGNLLFYGVWGLYIGIPASFFFFTFYRYRVTRTPTHLVLSHEVLGLPLKRKKIPLTPEGKLVTENYLESPNKARLDGDIRFRGFQNRGHFALRYYPTPTSPGIFIDRCSSQNDLERTKKLLFF